MNHFDGGGGATFNGFGMMKRYSTDAITMVLQDMEQRGCQ